MAAAQTHFAQGSICRIRSSKCSPQLFHLHDTFMIRRKSVQPGESMCFAPRFACVSLAELLQLQHERPLHEQHQADESITTRKDIIDLEFEARRKEM